MLIFFLLNEIRISVVLCRFIFVVRFSYSSRFKCLVIEKQCSIISTMLCGGCLFVFVTSMHPARTSIERGGIG